VADSDTRTPRPFVLLSAVTLVLGLVGFAVSWIFYPPFLDLRLVLIMTGAALSEFFSFSFPVYSMSLAYPLSMAAAVLGGPAAACVVSAVSSISLQDIRSGRPLSILAFNLGQLLLSTAVGAWAFVLLSNRVLVDSSHVYTPLQAADFPDALIGMTAAALLSYGVNFVLTSAGVALLGRASFRSALRSGLSLVPTQAALAFVGFLMAQVLAIAAVTLPLFIFPLAVGRQFYQRYVGLRDAYRDTIRSLVGALETKDAYTRGHSVRVAVYAAQIGRSLGLEEGQLESLEYAALLHDLGKLSLPSDILTKPDRLTDAEMTAMKDHPAAGARMVERIPPLRGLTPHVGAHHEWFGGGGYPSGSSGERIPMLARVLSVADAYDAMTTDRAYRAALTDDEAIAEILAGSGTQFDPEVVDAFLAAHRDTERGTVTAGTSPLLQTRGPSEALEGDA